MISIQAQASWLRTQSPNAELSIQTSWYLHGSIGLENEIVDCGFDSALPT